MSAAHSSRRPATSGTVDDSVQPSRKREHDDEYPCEREPHARPSHDLYHLHQPYFRLDASNNRAVQQQHPPQVSHGYHHHYHQHHHQLWQAGGILAPSSNAPPPYSTRHVAGSSVCDPSEDSGPQNGGQTPMLISATSGLSLAAGGGDPWRIVEDLERENDALLEQVELLRSSYEELEKMYGQKCGEVILLQRKVEVRERQLQQQSLTPNGNGSAAAHSLAPRLGSESNLSLMQSAKVQNNNNNKLATPSLRNSTAGVTVVVQQQSATAAILPVSTGGASSGSRWCEICNLSVNSDISMAVHLRGGRHRKRSLKTSSPSSDAKAPTDPPSITGLGDGSHLPSETTNAAVTFPVTVSDSGSVHVAESATAGTYSAVEPVGNSSSSDNDQCQSTDGPLPAHDPCS